ncbi:PA domain-containing protein, partial [Bradyrhizobium sp. NBAIM08]|uniref:PA domain-containing protein n=1 Tax=Bradyrhizobium sp. NBAIM08 TaxID=2793815 RepID=UPI001CD30B83
YGTDYYVPVLNNNTRKASASKVVFVGYGISEPAYDDYHGLNVKGKVVVFFTGEPKVNGSYLLSGTGEFSTYTFPGIPEKIALAEKKGAVAAIVLSPAMAVLNSRTVSLNTKSNVYYPGLPADRSIG